VTDNNSASNMPEEVAAIASAGFATWASDDVNDAFREKFDAERIPVAGVRHVRQWGIQVDDERALPGHERTQIPDEEIWEVNLVAIDGSRYEVDSRLVRPA
jgi:hypothetical protein